MLQTPEFWVLVSFLGFIALLVYFGVPGMVGKSLDDRAIRIKSELEEARRLREEAQNLLVEYQRKQRDAESGAKAIVEQAQHEADLYAAEQRQKLQDSLARRMKMAEDKIAQAEAQALQEIRERASDVAIAAAGRLIAENLSKDKAQSLLDDGIKGLAAKLN